MNVGVLELIAYTVPPEWAGRAVAALLRRHLYSIMPQAVAAWCRQAGHRVTYATYFGQADPLTLLPKDLDVVFLSCPTQGCGLAYALAKAFRAAGVRTVLGGPHAKCFPHDAKRFFDAVVRKCDRDTCLAIVNGGYPTGAIIESAAGPADVPTVEERLPDVLKTQGRKVRVVSLLASVGCPYTCDFCTEWNSPYRPLAADRLTADLRFIGKRFPDAVIGYHDPNFAVRFDETLNAVENAGVRPNRYAMECSLSVLRGDRLPRLKRTNCVYVAPGVESWFGYGNKSTAGVKDGPAKLDHVVDRFREVRKFVPGLQANFLFGTDDDRGPEPATLTAEFARRLPYVWPNVNIPTPYGGTPLFDRYRAEGRLLRGFPLAFYCMPYLATTLRNYDPVSYYKAFLELYRVPTTVRGVAQRLTLPNPWPVRLALGVQAASHRTQAREMTAVLNLLETDRRFRAYHDGENVPLPAFYQKRYDQRLGRYAELLTPADRVPVFE